MFAFNLLINIAIQCMKIPLYFLSMGVALGIEPLKVFGLSGPCSNMISNDVSTILSRSDSCATILSVDLSASERKCRQNA